MAGYPALALYLLFAALLVAGLVLISGRLAPRNPSLAKSRPYECGVSEPLETQTRWPVRFSLVAMLFLVFDVMALFFFAWSLVLRELRWAGIAAMAGFFAVLAVGYLYARWQGALKWR